MLWYVIQTYTGKEEKVVEMVRKIVPGDRYGECFVAYHEQLRCREQKNQVHIRRIFPGYAFITSDDPDGLFFSLKKIPAMSKIITSGEFHFMPLRKIEAEFLGNVMDERHVIRLSYVATDGRDHVSWISGPLRACGGRVMRYQFRKRYATVRLEMAGQEKEVRMGIILNDDIRREVAYGKVEAPVTVPGQYLAAGLEVSCTPDTEVPREKDAAIGKITAGSRQGPVESDRNPAVSGQKPAINGQEPSGNKQEPSENKRKPAARAEEYRGKNDPLRPGDPVIVISGAFQGVPAVVCRVKRTEVRIQVRLFERDIMAEVPSESVRKIG